VHFDRLRLSSSSLFQSSFPHGLFLLAFSPSISLLSGFILSGWFGISWHETAPNCANGLILRITAINVNVKRGATDRRWDPNIYISHIARGRTTPRSAHPVLRVPKGREICNYVSSRDQLAEFKEAPRLPTDISLQQRRTAADLPAFSADARWPTREVCFPHIDTSI